MVWPEKSFQPCQIMPRSAAHLQWLPSRSEKSPLPLVLPHPHRHTGLLAVRPPLASFCLRTFASAVPLLTSLCSSSRYLRLHTLNTFNTSLKRHHLRLIFLIPRNGLPGALFFSRLTPDIYLIFENFFIPCLSSWEHSSVRSWFCSLLPQHPEQWVALTRCSINPFWMMEWNKDAALSQQILLMDAEEALKKQVSQ